MGSRKNSNNTWFLLQSPIEMIPPFPAIIKLTTYHFKNHHWTDKFHCFHLKLTQFLSIQVNFLLINDNNYLNFSNHRLNSIVIKKRMERINQLEKVVLKGDLWRHKCDSITRFYYNFNDINSKVTLQ